MGWNTVATLSIDDAPNQTDGKCYLLSRGGLNGIKVHVDDEWISIPKAHILTMIAEEYISEKIAELGSMSTDDVVTKMFR